MAEPCKVVYKGKEIPYEQFLAQLHDGLLKEFVDKGFVNPDTLPDKTWELNQLVKDGTITPEQRDQFFTRSEEEGRKLAEDFESQEASAKTPGSVQEFITRVDASLPGPAAGGAAAAPGSAQAKAGQAAAKAATPPGTVNSTPASVQNHVQNTIGAKPNGPAGRIQVDPIVGGTAKKLSDIIFDVSKKVKQKVLYAKPGRSRAIGTYSPGNTAIKLKFSGNLDVFAHELGHSMDDLFNILGPIVTNPSPAIEAELAKFSPYGSKAPQGHPNPQEYERSEGFAEWLRAFILNPAEAIASAPELYDLYKNTVSQEYQDALTDFSNDVRTWAGSTGHDMTLANVEVEPTKASPLWKEIFSKRSPKDDFMITWVDKLAAEFVNPMQAANKAFEYAMGLKGVDEVLPRDDFRVLVRLLAGFDGKFGDMIVNGMVDSELNRLKDKNGNVKNLNWLFEPLYNQDEKTIKEEMKNVVAYMISERAVELAQKFGRTTNITGTGAGIYSDIAVAKKTMAEYEAFDDEKKARIKEAADRYREFADDIMRYMVDKGRIAEEVYDKDGNLIGGYKFIKQNNLQYVALKRVMETEPNAEIDTNFGSSKNIGSVFEPIRAIKGSSKAIVNPYISLIDMLYKGMKEADRNDILRSFRDMIMEPRAMYQGQPKKFAQIGAIGKQGDKNSKTIFVDGKAEHWIFDDDVYKVFSGLEKNAFKFHPVITMLPKAMHWSITHFPVFGLRNIIRDTQERMMKSVDKSGFKDLFADKEHWSNIAKAGGLNAGYYMRDKTAYYGLMEQAFKELSKDKRNIFIDPKALGSAWSKYEGLLQKSETVNRVAEYQAAFKNAKAKGMSDYDASLYAGYRARDLMDFALMGNTMQWVNQIVLFSNAGVQGLRSSVNSAKQNPAAFGGRLFLYSIMPTIMLWLLNHRDEETAKEYGNLPAFQRDMFFNFKLGNKWFVIPKPHEISLFGSAVDRLMSKFYGNKDAFQKYGGTVSKSLIPVDESNLLPIAPAATEAIINYDVWRDKAIIYDNSLDLAMRNTEEASRLGQMLQEVSGIDARKLDHFIQGQFGGFGKTAIQLSDIGREDGQKFSINDLGFTKDSPAWSAPKVQEFMDYAEKWDLKKSRPMKQFYNIAREYKEAKDPKIKADRAKAMIDFAKLTLMDWKAANMEEYQKEKQEYKRERNKRR